MVPKFCSRSHGQPLPGVRNAAMISSSRVMSRDASIDDISCFHCDHALALCRRDRIEVGAEAGLDCQSTTKEFGRYAMSNARLRTLLISALAAGLLAFSAQTAAAASSLIYVTNSGG